MSYLDYYRQNPAWATSQWQSIAPPMPSFQPQPSWGGYDYFQSAVGSMNVDPSLYGYASTSLRNPSAILRYGSSMAEAKMQHRRAYGGLGDVLVMAPPELGAAAAYEVWRNWRYHNGILAQPLAGDAARQREALVGLAIGESAKLAHYARRPAPADAPFQAAAAEAAALAAARIFNEGSDALRRAGGAYGALGASPLGAGALSPVLGPVGVGVGAGGAYPYGAMSPARSSVYDPAAMSVGMGVGAPGMARRRSASFGGIPPSPYAAAGLPPPPLTSASAYAGSDAGLYGAADGMLGAGAGAGYDGGYGARPFSRSRPASPVYPPRPLSAMGGGSYAGSVVDDAVDRRLAEFDELGRRERERVGRRGSRYGGEGYDRMEDDYEYDPEYRGYTDERAGGGGSYRRGYDDIDGYGYGRRRHAGGGYPGVGRRERFADGYY